MGRVAWGRELTQDLALKPDPNSVPGLVTPDLGCSDLP